MDIDYGHKSSFGWIYSTYGPDDIQEMTDYLDQHMNWSEEITVYDGFTDNDGVDHIDSWTEMAYCQWMIDPSSITKITDPDSILRHYHDEGIAGFGKDLLTSTDIDNIQEYFGLDPIFGPKYYLTTTIDVENPDRVGETVGIPF